MSETFEGDEQAHCPRLQPPMAKTLARPSRHGNRPIARHASSKAARRRSCCSRPASSAPRLERKNRAPGDARLLAQAAASWRQRRLRAEVEPVGARRHLDGRAVEDVAEQDPLRQRVLQLLLDHALQRTRAIGRVVALRGQPVDRLLVERQRDLAIGQQLSSRLSWISTIAPMSCRRRRWNRMTSSTRFRNSGRNAP
jgi:hypothetical protein